MRIRSLAIALAVALPTTLCTAPVLGAQGLRLGEALDRADARAYANRANDAMADAAKATARLPLKGILPSLRTEAGLIHTTDPIGAFGTTLRQRAITQQDFDPARLNFPATARNVVGALVAEVPLFNADAWAGRRAAGEASTAAAARADWTRVDSRSDVIRAYFGTALAAEQIGTYEAGVRAAQGHVRQAQAMTDNGLVTASDALLAQVKAGDVEIGLLNAKGNAANALRGLATLLGAPDASALPSTPLPTSDRVREVVTLLRDATPTTTRADIVAAEGQRAAAVADARRAQGLFLPRINAFARYDWNDPRRVFGGEHNWTAGVMASWSIFGAGSEIAETQAATSRRRAADAMADGATAQAALEVAQTTTALDVALARLTIADRSVAQATDAARIVGRRYAGGLATIVELFDATAMETQATLAASAARYDALVALAQHLQATGRDPGALRIIDSDR
jgi:outer membrane protein